MGHLKWEAGVESRGLRACLQKATVYSKLTPSGFFRNLMSVSQTRGQRTKDLRSKTRRVNNTRYTAHTPHLWHFCPACGNRWAEPLRLEERKYIGPRKKRLMDHQNITATLIDYDITKHLRIMTTVHNTWGSRQHHTAPVVNT